MQRNPSFDDLRKVLPIAEFMRLESYLKDPETKVYQRDVTNVVRKQAGSGEVGLIRYVPVEGKFEDSGEIKTAFLNDQLAFFVCKLAKSFIGKRCIFFQRNIDKSENQPTGFRELCWIQVVEDPNG